MEDEKVDTKRAEEWLRSILEMDGYTSTATIEECNELLLSECSRLASRVEELEAELESFHNPKSLYGAVWLRHIEKIQELAGRVRELEEALRLMVDESSPTGVPNRLTRDTFKKAESVLAGAHAEEKPQDG